MFGTLACIALAILPFATAHAQNACTEGVSSSHQGRPLADGPFAAFISEASLRFGVPEHWINAILRIESDGDVRARSPKGAMGLMQIMPGTWSELRLRYHLGSDPFDPCASILAGAAYLRELYDRYGSPGFLAAYNAGPARYDEHLAGRQLPAETQIYVTRLAPLIAGREPCNTTPATDVRTRPWTKAPLFAVRTERNLVARLVPTMRPSNSRSTVTPVRRTTAIMSQGDGLFVVRSRAGAS
nr:lytic transglycosylase domain-containing protein [Bradyrhizobium tropiciagri]